MSALRIGAASRGGLLADAVELSPLDPKPRSGRDFANPDPRPKPRSPAPADDRLANMGAFGRRQNWLEEWTASGAESDCDPQNTEESP